MNHYVVVEIERQRQYTAAGDTVSDKCWNLLYKVPIQSNNYPSPWDSETSSFDGCLVWIENNKVEGSKYAVVKMYLIP